LDKKTKIKYLWLDKGMTDTPQEIKEIQLKIWLSKSPRERLRQMMLDNEALVEFWNNNNIPLLSYRIKTLSLSITGNGLQFL
jgi:hypothetical protein